MRTKYLLSFAAVTFFFIGLSSCIKQTVPVDKRSKEITEYNALESTIRQYYDVRKKNNLEAMYGYFSSNYTEAISLHEFKDIPIEPTFGLMYYYITGIDFEAENKARVYVTEYTKPGGIPSFILFTDSEMVWIKENGKWVYDREIMRPGDMPPSVCGGKMQPRNPSKGPAACGS